PNIFLYSAERYDSSVGLYDLRARYYNLATGRFWSRDQIEGTECCGLSWNPYLYVRDNSVNAVDPSGREFYIDFIKVIKFEFIPGIVITARWVCYTIAAATFVAEEVSGLATGHFFKPP